MSHFLQELIVIGRGFCNCWSMVFVFFVSTNTVIADNPPTIKTIFNALFQHSAMGIDSFPQCHGAGTDLADKTLGNYLAGYVANFAETGENQITEDCSPVNGGWSCKLMFRHSVPDSEISSANGFEFLLDNSGVLEKKSLVCIGVG